MVDCFMTLPVNADRQGLKQSKLLGGSFEFVQPLGYVAGRMPTQTFGSA